MMLGGEVGDDVLRGRQANGVDNEVAEAVFQATTDEVEAAASQLAKHRLSAEVLQVRAHGLSEPTTAVRLSRQ